MQTGLVTSGIYVSSPMKTEYGYIVYMNMVECGNNQVRAITRQIWSAK